MRSITEQLSDARERSGLSVAKLLAKSGLAMERSALQRKLSGDRPLHVREAQALAKALGITLVWDPGARGRA